MLITIHNFQSHAHTELNLGDPGMYAIVGRNGHGKSAILRAIKTVPLGGTLDRRHGTNESYVSINGCSRVFEKGKGFFRIEGIEGELKALRSSVPAEVKDRLKLSEINFRDQHDAYFLLSDTPGARARVMNEFADLGEIDYVSSALKSEGKSLEAEKKVISRDLATVTDEIKDLDWAIAADTDYQLVERQQQITQEAISHVSILQEQISYVKNLLEKLRQFPDPDVLSLFHAAKHATDKTGVKALTNTLNEISVYADYLMRFPDDMNPSLREVQKSLDKLPDIPTLKTLIDQWHEYAEDLRLCPNPEEDIARLKSVDLTPVPFSLVNVITGAAALTTQLAATEGIKGWEQEACALRTAEGLLENARSKDSDLRVVMLIHESKQKAYNDLDAACTKAKAELDEAFKEAGTCPLCGADCGGSHG